MPYDRKTELLWNYLSMAQFTDLSRIWSQGPAHTAPSSFTDWGTSATITLRTNDTGPAIDNDAPPRYIADTDPGSASSSHSASSSAPVTDELGDVHSRIVATPYIPPLASANHSGGMPTVAGAGQLHGEAVSAAIHSVNGGGTTTTPNASHNTDSSTIAPASSDPPAETPPVEDPVPKVYGPSEVATSGTIESAPSTQSNDVANTLSSDSPNVMANAGSDHVGNIIDQMENTGRYHGDHFAIDYIHGNMTSLTSIQQLNTIFDNDFNAPHSSVTAPVGSTLGDNSLSQSVTSGENTLGNHAVLQGNADLANYDALVVTGDLTVINRIVQVNLIDDNDTNTVNAHADISTPYGTASSIWDAAVQSGGNVQVNVGFIIDNHTGAVYLVGGTYGTFTSATQVNILSNDDLNTILSLFHSQEGTGFLGFSTDDVIQSGGDNQSNQAVFSSGDSASDNSNSSEHGHSSHASSDLTSLLHFAHLHSSQDDGLIHVLYVDGDYTIVNLVVQINVIHDADTNTLSMDASGATGSLTGPPEPTSTDTTSGAGAMDDGTTNTGDSTSTTGTDDNGSGTAHEGTPQNGDGGTGHSDSPQTGGAAEETQTTDGTTTGTSDNATPDHQPPDAAAGSSTADSGQHTTNDNGTGTLASGSDASASSTSSSGGSDTSTGSGNDTASHGGAAESDSSLPVYNDHSSLNYDQVVSSGGNDAGNHATIIDGGNGGPQLIIVQGHYYEYNEILQVNILMDSDHNTVTSAMNAPVPGGADTSEGTHDSTHLTTADDVLKSMTG